MLTSVETLYTNRSGQKTLNWNEHVHFKEVVVRNIKFTTSEKLTQLSIKFNFVY